MGNKPEKEVDNTDYKQMERFQVVSDTDSFYEWCRSYFTREIDKNSANLYQLLPTILGYYLIETLKGAQLPMDAASIHITLYSNVPTINYHWVSTDNKPLQKISSDVSELPYYNLRFKVSINKWWYDVEIYTREFKYDHITKEELQDHLTKPKPVVFPSQPVTTEPSAPEEGEEGVE